MIKVLPMINLENENDFWITDQKKDADQRFNFQKAKKISKASTMT